MGMDAVLETKLVNVLEAYFRPSKSNHQGFLFEQ
jgi:hypothetical protein